MKMPVVDRDMGEVCNISIKSFSRGFRPKKKNRETVRYPEVKFRDRIYI
jgi:hypothetical protein